MGEGPTQKYTACSTHLWIRLSGLKHKCSHISKASSVSLPSDVNNVFCTEINGRVTLTFGLGSASVGIMLIAVLGAGVVNAVLSLVVFYIL